MHRLTVYITPELHAAICAHADAAGQKLSTFIGRELAHLVSQPATQTAAKAAYRNLQEKGVWRANAKREAR